jgi:hypothetical protein
MFNGLLGSNLSQGYTDKQNIFYAIFPIFILLFLGSNFLKGNSKLKLNIDTNLYNKINMINEVIPYFSDKEQVILSKVSDILDIINRFNRVIKANYDVKLNDSAANMAKDEKMEKILVEMSKHLEGGNKELAQNLIDVKHRIDQTKVNLNTYNEKVSANQVAGINSIIELMKCFMPVLDENHKKTVNKVERIMEIVKEN